MRFPCERGRDSLWLRAGKSAGTMVYCICEVDRKPSKGLHRRRSDTGHTPEIDLLYMAQGFLRDLRAQS